MIDLTFSCHTMSYELSKEKRRGHERNFNKAVGKNLEQRIVFGTQKLPVPSSQRR